MMNIIAKICAIAWLLLLLGLSARAESIPLGFVPTTKLEKLAATTLENFSEKELREMLGLFAPIVKKWEPVGQRFAIEYMTTTNRVMVISKYLPDARKVIDEAKQMKLPERALKQRERYVLSAEALYSAAVAYIWYNRKFAGGGK